MSHVTDLGFIRKHAFGEVPVMPIFFMALLALAVFVGMGVMLFYAAYAETKTEHELARRGSAQLKPGSETHAPVA